MNTITVGNQVLDIGSEARITIFASNLETISVGGLDLYDLGLRYSEIERADGAATIKIGNITIELLSSCHELQRLS